MMGGGGGIVDSFGNGVGGTEATGVDNNQLKGGSGCDENGSQGGCGTCGNGGGGSG